MNNRIEILTKSKTTAFRNLKRSKFRKQDGLFLLEGLRLCEEAFNADLEITACVTEKGFDALSIPTGITHFQATRTQIEQISDSQTPQGIICIAKTPTPTDLPEPAIGEIVLALDGLSDPGNLGAILRSALWFGLKHILLGPGCVDPFSPKVVRSSMGAIAHLNIQHTKNLLPDIETWKGNGGDAAALHMIGETLKNYQPERGLLLVLGSEAHGVDPQILNICTPLSIKRTGAGESLNAAMAASIALYELKGR